MEISNRIRELRQQYGYSQEHVAEQLNVSRQAVSKWESGRVYPDIENIIALSELFSVTTDSLLKGSYADTPSKSSIDSPDDCSQPQSEQSKTVVIRLNGRFTKEYKSKATLFGVPLIHINLAIGIGNDISKNKKGVAKGIIAIGNVAIGVISLGLVSAGIISLGILSLGLLAFGTVALGGLGFGAIAMGFMAFGAVAIGYSATGAVAIGVYSSGALAIASNVAVGAYAYGNVAIGETVDGVKELVDYNAVSSFPSGLLKRGEVQDFIREEYPGIPKYILNLLTAWFKR